MIGWIYQSEKTVIKGDFEVVESTNDYSKDLAEVLFANQDKLMDHTRRQQFFRNFLDHLPPAAKEKRLWNAIQEVTRNSEDFSFNSMWDQGSLSVHNLSKDSLEKAITDKMGKIALEVVKRTPDVQLLCYYDPKIKAYTPNDEMPVHQLYLAREELKERMSVFNRQGECSLNLPWEEKTSLENILSNGKTTLFYDPESSLNLKEAENINDYKNMIENFIYDHSLVLDNPYVRQDFLKNFSLYVPFEENGLTLGKEFQQVSTKFEHLLCDDFFDGLDAWIEEVAVILVRHNQNTQLLIPHELEDGFYNLQNDSGLNGRVFTFDHDHQLHVLPQEKPYTLLGPEIEQEPSIIDSHFLSQDVSPVELLQLTTSVKFKLTILSERFPHLKDQKMVTTVTNEFSQLTQQLEVLHRKVEQQSLADLNQFSENRSSIPASELAKLLKLSKDYIDYYSYYNENELIENKSHLWKDTKRKIENELNKRQREKAWREEAVAVNKLSENVICFSDDEINVKLKEASLQISMLNGSLNKNQTVKSLLNKWKDAQSKLIKEQSQRLSMKNYVQKELSYLSKEKLAEYANIAEQRINELKTKNFGDNALEQQISFWMRCKKSLLSELKSIEMLEKRKKNIAEFPFLYEQSTVEQTISWIDDHWGSFFDRSERTKNLLKKNLTICQEDLEFRAQADKLQSEINQRPVSEINTFLRALAERIVKIQTKLQEIKLNSSEYDWRDPYSAKKELEKWKSFVVEIYKSQAVLIQPDLYDKNTVEDKIKQLPSNNTTLFNLMARKRCEKDLALRSEAETIIENIKCKNTPEIVHILKKIEGQIEKIKVGINKLKVSNSELETEITKNQLMQEDEPIGERKDQLKILTQQLRAQRENQCYAQQNGEKQLDKWMEMIDEIERSLKTTNRINQAMGEKKNLEREIAELKARINALEKSNDRIEKKEFMLNQLPEKQNDRMEKLQCKSNSLTEELEKTHNFLFYVKNGAYLSKKFREPESPRKKRKLKERLASLWMRTVRQKDPKEKTGRVQSGRDH